VFNRTRRTYRDEVVGLCAFFIAPLQVPVHREFIFMTLPVDSTASK
jgi:hypothetical protein